MNPSDSSRTHLPLARLLQVSLLACLPLFSSAQSADALARGESLARQFCQGCHLFPEPQLLPRDTWAHHALRRMAPYLGVARLNLDARPDGQVLREAQIHPHQPLLPEADWSAIVQYYLHHAPPSDLPQPPRPPIAPASPLFQPEPISHPAIEPAITLVHIDPHSQQLLLGDARRNALHVLDSKGRHLSSTPVPSPPVHFLHHQNQRYLTLIGHLFPSDLPSGQVVTLQPTPHGFSVHPLLSQLQRPVHTTLLDLNTDGRQDLVIAQFGNELGRLSAFVTSPPGDLVEDTLIPFPGALRSAVVDANHDGLPDLLVLLGQAREGLYLLRNLGNRTFDWQPLLHFPPTYGSTGFELADFNDDGSPDLLVTHGDNGDFPSPFRPYHGLRLYLNDGHFRFQPAWFFPLNGAFKAVARDFDGDGDLDIAAISFFPDLRQSPGESFVLLENRGNLEFTPSTLPEAMDGRWLTMDAADLDGDGDFDLVLGSMIDGPRSVPFPPEILEAWRTHRVAALILRNTSPPRHPLPPAASD